MPATGWDVLPHAADVSLEANLARIKYYCNQVYAHQVRRQGGAMGANAPPPPPPRAEKVRLDRAIDEKKDAKDESFLLIFQRTLLFIV